ncbi:MAG TPA: glycosyltransferase family 39 protein [Alphaproteobacteria bacterium]|nr:glycosyltransferase family 39 protein [Alphaproteobacteria bacterium]
MSLDTQPPATEPFAACRRLAESRWAVWALLALCLAMFVPGIASFPVTDRDEARYAQASAQMAQTGDYVHIRFQDEPRNKKPVGIYWLQAAAVQVTGELGAGAIWPYRLPSLVGASLAVLLLFTLGRAAFGPSTAFLAAGLLAACVLAASEARLAKTDAFLLATAVAAQMALIRIYLARCEGAAPTVGLAALFWIAEGAAILIKGPVVPFITLLTGAALALTDRKTRWLSSLRFGWGVPLMVLIAAPWFVVLGLEGGGGNFVRESVGHDLLPKLLGGEESHGGWPGTYLLLSPLTFWPGSLVLVPALVVAWRERASPRVRALLCWLVPAWIAFELVPTKLPHYVLPLYPALALLMAWAAVEKTAASGTILKRFWGRLWLGLWALLGLALAALGIGAAAVLQASSAMTAAVGLLVAGVVLVVGAIVFAARAKPTAALGFATVLAIPFYGLLFAGVAPRLDPIWVSRSASALVTKYAGEDDFPIAAAGYSEPSLVFYLGTATVLTDGKGAADALAAGDAGMALVESREAEAFRAEASKRGVAVQPLGAIHGLDYSRGRPTTLTLYRPPR